MLNQHTPGDGTNWWVGTTGSGDTRYVIVQGGVVVGVVVLPSGHTPTLSLGQTAVASDTLQVGDKP